jgi:hypothetical protein
VDIVSAHPSEKMGQVDPRLGSLAQHPASPRPPRGHPPAGVRNDVL